ncbi:hypothetical protein SAMN04487895_10368 [Paenibacillus sophorae]|uniref:Uncharacterized protein n=1 Tax=Paenibacillus sophorae TaxID=1333845 RepID=A0A1H8JL29_9BACL|nr:hypothetical protein [Paenibacillus sophorae]QWU13402.1 hypothetical protein KP014_15485 [Paenibacillus sophorae]SEN81484.1 hypothetical protein SAMN04487895_10368 [Paenibacillus sophorae]
MLNLGRYGSRNNLNLQIFDFVSSTPIMTFDYATTTTNEFTGETVYARGGDGNPRRISWSGDKDSTLAVETQVFTLQHLAMLAGEPIEKGAQNIYKSQVVTVESDGSGGKKITLSKAPINGTESVKVFSYVNGIISEPQTVSNVTGKDVTLDSASTIQVGQDVEVYYQFTAANAAKLSYTSKGFPGYVWIAGDTLYADEKAGDVVAVQQVFRKAKLQPNFTVTYSPTGDPSSLSLTFDLFPVLVNGQEVMKEEIIYEDEE